MSENSLYGPDGRPVGSQAFGYQLGPNLLTLPGDPHQLFEEGFNATGPGGTRQGHLPSMIQATWASASVALMHAGQLLGSFEVRLQALERLLGRDPQFAEAYKAEMNQVAAELQQAAAQHAASAERAGGPGGGPAN